MLIDRFSRPLRDLRISVTDRCNFRCNYCMPADIFGHNYVFMAKKEILTFEEICRIVKIFLQLGVTKIRLTGGEPLLRQDIEVLVDKLNQNKEIQDIALTTNGSFLEKKTIALKQAGLQRITVSLDTLDPELLKKLAGQHLDLKLILGGIQYASKVGLHPIKINAVIQKGINDGEILKLAKFAKTHGYIMRFIEFMDVGNLNDWKLEKVVSAQEIVNIISAELPIEPIDKNYPGEVANGYRYLDGEGEIGIISSVTHPFCENCTRARLSAEGKIYTCLFANQGLDIKKPLRAGASDKELLELINTIWHKRLDKYSEQRTSHTKYSYQQKIEMYQIGG